MQKQNVYGAFDPDVTFSKQTINKGQYKHLEITCLYCKTPLSNFIWEILNP